jgi:hypothetical protein
METSDDQKDAATHTPDDTALEKKPTEEIVR